VHVSADFAPYGAARDERVAEALGPFPLVRAGSPYAVAPGRVTKDDGTPFKVYSAFYRAWADHGWRAPAESGPDGVTWEVLDGTGIPDDPRLPAGLRLPEAGEAAALAACRRT
jgi:deoxyribodipyrimidine photo-lyase